jgi:hypothetical protein
MAKFDALTDGELTNLKAIVQEYQRLKQFTDRDIYWGFLPALDENSLVAQIDAKAQSALAAAGALEPQNMEANYFQVKRWAEAGYISISPQSHSPFTVFLITPRGLDFVAHMSRPKWQRRLLDTWADWRPELRSALVSAVTSLAVTLVTAYLILAFHLYH